MAFCIVLIMMLCLNCFALKEPEAKALNNTRTYCNSFTDAELQKAMKEYIGIRYKRAGASKKGFDCSGFVKVFYKKYFGIDLPHQSSQQFRSTELNDIPGDNLQTGDLIFFSLSKKKKNINHVGIYFSDGKFIHATNGKGVIISDMDDAYWKPKIIDTKRLPARNYYADLNDDMSLDFALLFDRQDAIFFRYEKLKLHVFSDPIFINNPERIYSANLLQRVEFGYEKMITPVLATQLNVFRNSFSPVVRKTPTDYLSIQDYQILSKEDGIYAQGLKLAGDFRHSENLSIIPSISYYEYGPGVEMNNLPRVTMDLTYDLYSLSEGWSLSTGFRIPINRYPSSLSAPGQDNDLSVDLTMTYHQKIADNIHLSLSGNNFINFLSGMDGSSSNSGEENRNFNFTLQFFY